MVGVHVISHLARRAVAASQDEFKVEQLKKAAQLYEDTPDAQISPVEMLPIFLTAIAFILLFISVRYTLGEVVSTLAMIEQPQTTVVERSTRLVSDDSDSSLDKQEKEHLIDEEVIVIKQDPITSQIRKTIRHLHSVGGFTARWRGLGVSIMYNMAHTFAANLIGAFFSPESISIKVIAYVISSVLLSKIHMTWTHVMISKPSAKPWYKRVCSDKQVWKTLALPSFVYATAQVSTFGLPMLAMCVLPMGNADGQRQLLGMLLGGATMLVLGVAVLLPASVTLTRIEASFLPEDEDTIVPFDRTLNGAKGAALTLDDGTQASVPSGKSLFIEAWRSFDMSSRLRLIKFYIKMVAIQSMIVVVGVHVIVAEVYVLGMARITVLAQAGSAQMRLAAMGAEQN